MNGLPIMRFYLVMTIKSGEVEVIAAHGFKAGERVEHVYYVRGTDKVFRDVYVIALRHHMHEATVTVTDYILYVKDEDIYHSFKYVGCPDDSFDTTFLDREREQRRRYKLEHPDKEGSAIRLLRRLKKRGLVG